MEARLAYCATCDRPVRVLVRKEAPSWPTPYEPDPGDIVCLEHGESCTGAMCPIFELPTDQMRENLAEYRRMAEEGA